MANPEHVEVVKKAAKVIAAWGEKHPVTPLDLSDTLLSGADLSRANLTEADLTRAHLTMERIQLRVGEMRKATSLIICAIGLALLSAACTISLTAGSNLGDIYSYAASHLDEHRNPVIVIPGILGSKMVEKETGDIVWGAFAGRYVRPSTGKGARLFALPMREGVPLRELEDNVVSAGVLDRFRVNLLGLPLELNAYVSILGTLGVGGYRDDLLGISGAVEYGEDHFTCFQFDYDWRRDIVESAQRLHEFIEEKRQYVQNEMDKRYGKKNRDVKFDIVAHSMGGLVARYFMRYGNADLPEGGAQANITWAGARYVDKVILVGTPNAGSLKALTRLVDGAVFAPFLPRYAPALIGTMPSVYQLLPRQPHCSVVAVDDRQDCIDPTDSAVWEKMAWGLASPKQDRVLRQLLPDIKDREQRRRIALDHLRKCLDRARRFHAAIDSPALLPRDVRMYLVAGDAAPTAALAEVHPKNGRVRVVSKAPGDGTVLRTSALMDQRVGRPWVPRVRSPIDWTGVTFLFSDHLGMTRDPIFHDNLLYLLMEQPVRKVPMGD